MLLLALVSSALTAVSDGKADATPAIQALIDTHQERIDLPKGTYRLTAPLVIEMAKTGPIAINGGGAARLLMAGAGPAIRFIGTHEGTASPDSFRKEVLASEISPMVDAVQIVGAHPEADGIEAKGTMQLTISRVTITDCRHGVHLVERNRNVILSACHIYKNSGIGVFYDAVNLHQSNLIGCHISYCYGGGVVSHGGNVRNLHIGTCDIESNMHADFPPTANVWLDSTDGSIGEVAITGCTIQHSSKAIACANVRIQGAGTDPSLEKRTGKPHTREGNITIADNVFSDIRCNVHVQDARGVTITGNTFWEGFDRDLLIERSSHIVIANNNFDRNPRYAVNGFNAAENNGVLLTDCDDTSLTGNIISGVRRQRAAVEIVNGTRLNIAQNQILDSDGIGLLLHRVRHSLVSDNLIRDDRAEPERTKGPSLKIVAGGDNVIGANVMSHGKSVE